MKIFLTITLFFLSISYGLTQSPLDIDRIQANAGIGIDGHKDDIPFYFGADYGILENFTAGARVSFNGNKYPFTIAVNSNYHLDEILRLPQEWNIYGGANLGYVDQRDDDGKAEFGLQIGSRYFVKQSDWALNLEFGGGTERTGGRFGATYVF